MKLKLTEAEFDELKRKRDEAIVEIVRKARAKLGEPGEEQVHFHCPDFHATCYCACPSGPCQHEWNGPRREFEDGLGGGGEITCSRCGMGSMHHDMRRAP